MASVPLPVALLIVTPFWRSGQVILGNIAGTAVIFGSAFGMILREHAEIDRVVQQCLEAGVPCFPEPPAFTRFAIYAFIGLGEVFVLFLISLRVEERIRARDYSPEWR